MLLFRNTLTSPFARCDTYYVTVISLYLLLTPPQNIASSVFSFFKFHMADSSSSAPSEIKPPVPKRAPEPKKPPVPKVERVPRKEKVPRAPYQPPVPKQAPSAPSAKSPDDDNS